MPYSRSHEQEHTTCAAEYMGVSENVVYPIVPNGFADHYPYEKWLFHWEYTLFSDKPISLFYQCQSHIISP